MSTSSLTGLTILNTRAEKGAATLSKLLLAQGAIVLECPMLEISEPASWQSFDAQCQQAPADWLLFTSANAVAYTVNRIKTQPFSWQLLSAPKNVVIGSATAFALKQHGLPVQFQPAQAHQEGMVNLLAPLLQPSDRVWWPCAQQVRSHLKQQLSPLVSQLADTPVYQSTLPKAGLSAVMPALLANKIDWVVFTSSLSAQHFWQMAPMHTKQALIGGTLKAAAIGHITYEQLNTFGIGAIACANEALASQSPIEALVQAIIDYA